MSIPLLQLVPEMKNNLRHCVFQGRLDDNEETVRARLKTFRAVSFPVIEYYAKKGKLYKVMVWLVNDFVKLGDMHIYIYSLYCL